MFTDSHCHLLNEYYEDINIVIEESKNNNIYRYICSGYDQKSNEEIIKAIEKYEDIFGTIGIHPEAVNEAREIWFNYLENNLTNKKIVGLGEIGLDYYYVKDNKELQIYWFEKQLKLAERLNLPVVIHSRDATEDTINCLKKYNVKGVIHSFSGSIETAREYIKMGFLLGINGTITFNNSKLKNVIKEIGINNIILETDSPYLTPMPYRGQKNSPKHIKEIAKFISLNNDISISKLSEITENNIRELFDI